MNNEIKSFSIAVINDIPQEENMDFAICRIQALSDGYNTHKLKISNEVLKKYANTCLGKFVVAKTDEDMFGFKDFEGHEFDEVILGYIPPDAEIRFVENDSDNGIFFEVDAVISKLYTNGALDIFQRDGKKSVSCEFTCTYADDEQTEIESFNIRGITILGSAINPSCVGANAEIISFSERATEFYHDRENLQKFTETMAEKKSYKIDKSKESMSDKDWGDVDKTDLRNKIIEASNATTLVKSVYLLVEDGWEDAPSQHLKYPVMELKGDTFVYNRNALASAKGYAEKNNEQKVLDKLNKIYNKLGLNKEENTEMAKIEQFTAVDLSNLWCKLYKIIESRKEWGYCIEGIYEDAGQKFVIVIDDNSKFYRADFSFTDDGELELSNEAVSVEKEFIETGDIIKFEEPEGIEQYKTFAESNEEKDEPNDDEQQEEMSCGEKMEGEEEMGCGEKEMSSDAYVDVAAQIEVSNEQADKNEELAKELKEKEDIIMKYEEELAELRQFKADTLESQKMSEVSKLLAKLQGKIDEVKYTEIEAEGKEIKFEEFSAWKNSVLASYAEDILAFSETETNEEEDVIRMEIPQDEKPNGLWDRL